MLRYSLFGRPCRDACVRLFKVLDILQEQEGIRLEVKARKIAWSAVWAVLNRQLFRVF